MMDLRQLRESLKSKEDEHLEFKEAKKSIDSKDLLRYCAALANEGGGRLILGVTDKRPRRIVGSAAIPNLDETRAQLIAHLHLRIEVDELVDADRRVVVFTVPCRPLGTPIDVEGAYWMRVGDRLVPMTSDRLRQIFLEGGPDFSAEICPRATVEDLHPSAIAEFRRRWSERSRNQSIADASVEQLLRNAELVVDSGVTYAALILLGSRPALGKYLANAEVIFEYRASEVPGPASQREEFRLGFLAYYDQLWNLVNLRNDSQPFQDGLFMREIPTFNEEVIREGVLNAIAHRDYRNQGPVFVRQYQRRIEITSPGGFPAGVTPENILDRQNPRNRRIADVLAKCGLVERSGQGADRMFEASIREGKPVPDFSLSDEHLVFLTLRGQVEDPQFVRFLERVARETGARFDTHDLVVLDLAHRDEPVPAALRSRLRRLRELGVVETVGATRGWRVLLSRRFYDFSSRRGSYTRQRGLDRETNKQLLLAHISRSASGSPISELQGVLPSLPRSTVQRLLTELRQEGRIRLAGERRWARWVAERGSSGGPSTADQ